MILLYVTGTKSTLCCSDMFFFIIENCQVLFFFTSLWRFNISSSTSAFYNMCIWSSSCHQIFY